MSRLWGISTSIVLPVLIVSSLTACSSTDSDPAPTPAPTPASSAAPSAGETTTAPTVLDLGDAESLSWVPSPDVAGELSIRVDRVREGDFADFAGLAGSGIGKDNQPYYVDAVIVNEGDTDLGGLDVPLYLADSDARLSPPWGFATPFEPCDSGPLPESFAAGDRARMCLVFFSSPGASFESITFQPTLESPAVSWTGDVTVQKSTTSNRKRP